MPGYIPLRLFVPRVKCQKCETCLMTGWRSDCGVLIFQVFDAFIVITSFVADLCLLLLLPDYNTRDFVFILAFLLPWRVIRVVDSTCSNSNNQISLQWFGFLIVITSNHLIFFLLKLLIFFKFSLKFLRFSSGRERPRTFPFKTCL